jgi:hypothetical protein
MNRALLTQLAILVFARSAVAVDFATDILPVFESRCISCHGPDAQESGLRLDSRTGLLKGGDFGAAIIPGDAAGSHLVELVTATSADVRMPPDGERLTEAEVARLKTWIDQGAVWPGQMDAVVDETVTSDHWSFRPLAAAHAHDTIDGFLGTAGAVEAERRTLIRRVTLDLTGLPPTPEEVEAFVADTDPGAYEKVVDRLLASPHHGERWAQHWLDVIRFADTRGYEYNSLRKNTWPFRDWVIEAINRDLRYDRFLFQQIAGDTVGVDPATGFLVTAPLPTPSEVGQEPAAIRAARSNALDEIVQNVGASILGLTVGCARCHNHKFDPIPMSDYYRMVAVFSGVHYDSRPWRTSDHADRIRQLTNAEDRAAAVRAELAALPHWRELKDSEFTDHFRPVTAKFVRLTVLATDAADNGPAFDEIRVFLAQEPGAPPFNVAAASRGAKATSSGAATQLESRDEQLNDGKFAPGSVWVSARRPPAWVQIELPNPTLIERITWSRDRDLARAGSSNCAQRLATAWRIEIADEDGGWRTLVDEGRSAGLDVPLMNRRRELEEELDALNASLAKLRVGPEVFAGRFARPELINVLFRGDPQQPRDPVGPGGLSVLAGFRLPADAPEGERRVAFANWLVREAAPLTARVAVNRLWHHHFGTGLVSTPGDFGLVGARPTHPELLDWLAARLIADGWSLRATHRRIVSSAAYRQAVVQPVAPAAGFRRSLRRLDAEAIRDSMLATSGRLDRTMGGEGVNLFTRSGQFDQWKPAPEPPPGADRRMIYLTRIRGADDGMFKTFDLPECGQVKDKRSDSTTPLQALNLLNGGFTLAQASALAGRIAREAGPDLQAQVARAFEIVLSRPPSAGELVACLATARGAGLETVCRTLYNSNEFLYLP